MNTYKQKRGALLQEHLFIRRNWQNSCHMIFRDCGLCAAALVSRLDCQHCKTSVTCAQHPAGITDELTTGSPLRFPGLPATSSTNCPSLLQASLLDGWGAGAEPCVRPEPLQHPPSALCHCVCWTGLYFLILLPLPPECCQGVVTLPASITRVFQHTGR